MVQIVNLPKDGGYKPTAALPFEPYVLMVKRLGLPDARNKGPLSLIPEKENAAHQQRQSVYWCAIAAEEAAKQVHTCEDWEFDPDEDSPAVWCPACRHAEWVRHSRASQKLIVDAYLAEKYPTVKPVAVRKPSLTIVTALQKATIESGGALGLMVRDSLINNMRPWYYYCERDDREWLTRVLVPVKRNEPTMSMDQYMAIQEQLHGPVKRKAPREEPYRPTAASVAEPSFFSRVAAVTNSAPQSEGQADAPAAALSADEGKRIAAYAKWTAQDRNADRKPFHKGKAVAGSCKNPHRSVSDTYKVVLRNLPLEVDSLHADMWELVAQAGVVIDVYAPKGIFITMASPAEVDKVLAAWPNGVNYMGQVVTFERAGRR